MGKDEDSALSRLIAPDSTVGMFVFTLPVGSDTSSLSFKVIWRHPLEAALPPPLGMSPEPPTWSEITLTYVEAASLASV